MIGHLTQRILRKNKRKGKKPEPLPKVVGLSTANVYTSHCDKKNQVIIANMNRIEISQSANV